MRVLAAMTCMILLSCGPSLEEEAREGLATTLKDADSAKFRNLRKDTFGKICGQVNSKNSYGAYAGFTHFYVWDDLVYVDDADDEYGLAKESCD